MQIKERVQTPFQVTPLNNMQLTIKRMDGEDFAIEVEPHATVGHLRTLIHGVSGVPAAEQRLTGPGGFLHDDSKALSHSGLQSGSMVFIVHNAPPPTPVQPAPVQVFLKTHEGITKTYEIRLDETVARFQQMVANQEGVPIDQQRLIFNGKQLENHKKLQDYDITAFSTVHLSLRLRGG